jgi:hypothetical protein
MIFTQNVQNLSTKYSFSEHFQLKNKHFYKKNFLCGAVFAKNIRFQQKNFLEKTS